MIKSLAAKGRIVIEGDMVFCSNDRGAIVGVLKNSLTCVANGPFFHLTGVDVDGAILTVVVKCDGTVVDVYAALY